jgi:hypothetical protein
MGTARRRVDEDIPVTREFWQDLKAKAARLLKDRLAK